MVTARIRRRAFLRQRRRAQGPGLAPLVYPRHGNFTDRTRCSSPKLSVKMTSAMSGLLPLQIGGKNVRWATTSDTVHAPIAKRPNT
jgi:hypothetical protein